VLQGRREESRLRPPRFGRPQSTDARRRARRAVDCSARGTAPDIRRRRGCEALAKVNHRLATASTREERRSDPPPSWAPSSPCWNTRPAEAVDDPRLACRGAGRSQNLFAYVSGDGVCPDSFSAHGTGWLCFDTAASSDQAMGRRIDDVRLASWCGPFGKWGCSTSHAPICSSRLPAASDSRRRRDGVRHCGPAAVQAVPARLRLNSVSCSKNH
jgi:hypothetical protein